MVRCWSGGQVNVISQSELELGGGGRQTCLSFQLLTFLEKLVARTNSIIIFRKYFEWINERSDVQQL